MGVDHRHLTDRPRPGEGQLAAGRDVTEQQVRHRRAALRAGVPDVEDRRHVLRGPAQVQRTPVHDQQHDRGAGRDDRLQQLELTSGQLQRRPRGHLADHVLPLPHHDDRDIGVARRGRRPAGTRRPRRTPRDPTGCCRRTCRTATGTRAARPARRGRTRPATASPARARIPSSTVTVSSRSKSKTQGPMVSRGESASGPITAIELSAPASRGSRSPSLRSSTADRSAATRATSRWAGSASTSRARSSSTYGSSNRPIRIFASRMRRTLASIVSTSVAPDSSASGRWA